MLGSQPIPAAGHQQRSLQMLPASTCSQRRPRPWGTDKAALLSPRIHQNKVVLCGPKGGELCRNSLRVPSCPAPLSYHSLPPYSVFLFPLELTTELELTLLSPPPPPRKPLGVGRGCLCSPLAASSL